MKQDKYTDSFQVSIRTLARSKSGAILAYAGVTIFGVFAIRGVKIIKTLDKEDAKIMRSILAQFALIQDFTAI